MKEIAPASPTPDNLDALRLEVAGIIVEALNLEQAPASIDILEVALVVSKRYGFQLRADDDDNVKIFRSLRSLTGYIASHRTQ